MENIFSNYPIFLLLLIRITGFFFLNPILSRRNVPTMVKTGISFVIAILYASVNTLPDLVIRGYFDFALLAAKELFVGFVAGYIVNVFLSVTIVGGEIIDNQLGLTMSKVYDPTSSSQISITANLLNTMFLVYFFQSGAYLTLMQIIWGSYGVVTMGFEIPTQQVAQYMVSIFSNMFILSVKIAMPIIATHVITEMGVGILMKAVPQINIFVVNMQLKIVVGVIVFYTVLSATSRMLDNALNLMMGSISTALKLM